jgi:hypothetical protein
MPMAQSAIFRLLTGQDRISDRDEIRRVLTDWLQSDDPVALDRRLLGDSRQGARLRLRNLHLRRAAALLDHSAIALSAACRAFDARRWPRWKRLGAAPDHASDVDRHLFAARQFGPVALTVRQLRTVIGSDRPE